MFLERNSEQRTPTTATLSALPSGVAGVKATLKVMKRLALDGKKEMPVRMKALELVSHLQQKNFLGEIKALHRFVRDEIRYVRDIDGVETLQTPVKTLEFAQGDCDDKATLLAALLLSIGHSARFMAIGKTPGKLSHVYVETLYGLHRWVPLETTEPVEVGWSPSGVRTRLIAHI